MCIRDSNAEYMGNKPNYSAYTFMQTGSQKTEQGLQVNKLTEDGIVCHAYSPDRKSIVISLDKDEKVEIYELNELTNPRTWVKKYTLKEHFQKVTVVDWSPKNQILTGSYDRNVFVWSFNNEKNNWKPELVLIQQSRAVLCGGWDSDGDKFVVGTGSHKAMVGYYEKRNNWWQKEQIKGFKASVIAIAFHPSGRVVAIGSADQTVKIVSCYIDEVDSKKTPQTSAFSNLKSFGEILFDFEESQSWVQALSWSPSGKTLAFAAHNGLLGLFEIISEDDIKPYYEYVDNLPFLSLVFRNEEELLLGGFSKVPCLYKKSSNKWQLVKTFEVPEGQTGSKINQSQFCLLYTSPSPRDRQKSRMPSSA
eukprot:TRINITY_DN495_c0_g1_i17.p2 TRINITY_DN495_c0_g1~~TRINITY_DN495_c0_g1_i17.p2  ORF type:complete len:363 (-),score=69.51 TRINITY_DN495_c0_g1_i17:34-1122(-)